MKIFKYYQIDPSTGISAAIKKPTAGAGWPSFPGMQYVFDFNSFQYAYVDDSAEADPDNYIFEITEEEFSNDVENKVNQYLIDYKAATYVNEKALRELVFGKYDATAQIAGVYKYQEAVKFLEDGTPSVDITAEATARGVTETEIAEKIVVNHEKFRLNDATIAGLRGKILDRLDVYAFDAAAPLESWNELVTRMEVVGHREPNPGGLPGPEPENLEVKVQYYYPDLATRWNYLGT